MDTYNPDPENFSLSAGGPFNDALAKMNLQNTPGKIALAALCVAWLPLVFITAFEGTLFSGTQMPFLKDIAMQSRLLVALPMLIMIKLAIDSKVLEVSKYIAEALLSPEERDLILSTAIRRAKKLTSSALTEIIVLLIVVGLTLSMVKNGVYSALEGETSSWMATTNAGIQALSFSGYWAVFISIPLFQFLGIRWLWRYLVWALLLFRLSRAELNLLATHADRSGGVGIIILAQRNFNMLFVAGSVILSGQLVAELIKYPDTFSSTRSLVIGYIVISLVLVLIPLVFFAGKLVNTKQQGLIKLSKLGAVLSRKFDGEWINNKPIEKIIEEKQVDPSMVFDYSGMYDSLQQLRVVPVTIRDVIGMGIMLFVPFIPIWFVHFSVVELLQKIAGMLV
jgi:hypothetical protein